MKLPIVIGMQSLIGVGKQRPCSWGNYFYFDTGRLYGSDIRCINMWAENLITVRDWVLTDGLIECAVWNEVKTRNDKQFEIKYAMVVDSRIPVEWLYQKLCFTGTCLPSFETAREMFELVGDPDNELEQYTDPVSYWQKRGGTYNKNGSVTYFSETKTRKLKGNWSLEPVQDLDFTI